MRFPWRQLLLGVLIGAALSAFVTAWALGLLPTYVGYYFWWVGKALNWISPAITALATISIAWLTLTLRRSTDKLWTATQSSAVIAERALTQLERPHLRVVISHNNFKGFWDALASPAGAPIAARGTFDILFKNYGKYPAFTKALHFSVVTSESPPSGEGTLTPLSGDPIIEPDGQTLTDQSVI
jgi:hypothetical protein